MRSVVLVFSLLAIAVAPAFAESDATDGGLVDGGPPALEQPTLPPIPEVDGGIAQISLGDAVSRALAQNPQLQQAVDEAKRAQAIVEQTRAGWLPTITGNAVYTRLDHDRTLNNNGGGTPTVIVGKNSISANAFVSVPLFAPKAWLNTSVSDIEAAASQASAQDTRRLVGVAVARAYLTVLAQHRILEADLRSVADAQAHRDYAAQRFKGGVGNRVDLVRAQQELQSGLALVEEARTALARDQEALGVLVAENRPLDVAGEPSFPAAPADPQQAQQEATQRRKDLEALMMRSQAADDAVAHHWADFVPTLAVTFEPFYQNPASLTQPTTGWQATAALVWPIYDAGLRYGQQKERVLLASEAHTVEDAALRQARSDVRAALAEVEHADAALIAARQAAKLAHEALSLTNIAYHAGASTNIEVIDAERVALDADTQAAVAEDGARQARLDLLAATGRFP